MNKLIPAEEIAAFVPSNIQSSTLDGKLVMLPRAQFDVSALYYQKSIYADEADKKAFKEKYGYDLTPPDTWQQVTDQALFFTKAPDFYGTQFAGKEEAVQIAVSMKWFSPRAVNTSTRTASRPSIPRPVSGRSTGSSISIRRRPFRLGTTNYLWDDLGQGFASGSIAINLDWPGWASFFNDPKSSKVAGQCRRQGCARRFVRQADRLVRPSRLLGDGIPAPTRRPQPR